MPTFRIVLLALLGAATLLAQPMPPDLVDLLDRAAARVGELEQMAHAIVVEERYAQTAETTKNLGGTSIGVSGGVAMQESDTVKKKVQSRSELLLVRLEKMPQTWGAVRNTLEVDGKARGSAPGRLDALAADRTALAGQWTRLADASRDVHIGTVDRDLVAPMVALALLKVDQRSRLSFRKDGEERVRGTATWKVGFAEQRGPTLLRSRGNVPMAARGTIWIEPQTGRVFRTKLETGDGMSAEQWRIEVEYSPEPTTKAMLPSELRERYENERGKVDAKATYTGYRFVP